MSASSPQNLRVIAAGERHFANNGACDYGSESQESAVWKQGGLGLNGYGLRLLPYLQALVQDRCF